MKFIQLLSTIASLAIFATAPGVSAAGVRAGVDKTAEDQSAGGRRKLYRKHGGPRGPRGVPQGVPVDFNNDSESQYYNQIYNPGHGGGYYEGDGDNYYDNDYGNDSDWGGHAVNGYKMYREGRLP